MLTEEIRALLPAKEKEAFDDIVLQRVLGASKYISMIGRMFCSIAEMYVEKKDSATTDMINDIIMVAEYFKSTRGEASNAVCNAINFMLRDLDSLKNMDITEAAANVKKYITNYNDEMNKNIEDLTNYAVSKCGGMESIMVFDYSSTVNLFLQKLGAQKKGITAYIPESRIIDGGYAFVSTALNAGFKVHYLPDAAMMFYLKKCDAAFFGAETFHADGSALNTTGSDIVGLVCSHFNIPLYVLTPFIKLDTRPIYGYNRKQVYNSIKDNAAAFGFSQDELERVEFKCPELLPINSSHITAFITEKGIIPPNSMFEASLRFAKFLSEGEV